VVYIRELVFLGDFPGDLAELVFQLSEFFAVVAHLLPPGVTLSREL